jgi:hypothetical protein
MFYFFLQTVDDADFADLTLIFQLHHFLDVIFYNYQILFSKIVPFAQSLILTNEYN